MRRVSLHHANPALHAPAPVGGQLSPAEARITDPVLTTAARGYQHPAHVAHWLFPRVYTSIRGGRRVEFDRTDFRRVNSRRAPGADTREVQFGHDGEKFALTQHRLLGKQPIEPAEDAMQVAGIDMGMRAVDGVQAMISLEKEIAAATAATTAATYDAAHTTSLPADARWDDAEADPAKDVAVGIQAIRQATGMRPNVLLLGGNVFDRMRIAPKVLTQIRYVQKMMADTEDLERLLGVERVVIGDSIWVDENDDTHDVWGNHAVLAYTRIGSVDRAEPSYGYCYTLTGTPAVEEAWYDRRRRSWMHPVIEEYTIEVVGADAGYLIRNAVGD